MEEFLRLYGKPPTHVDGHKHFHLCTNVLMGGVLPPGLRVRRNFTFLASDKGWLQRTYRKLADQSLAKKSILTDALYSLQYALKHGLMGRVANLAKKSCVELMTHPLYAPEYDFLMGDVFQEMFAGVKLGRFDQNR